MNNTVSKTQIIYDEDGAPAFVVIPFAQYRQFVPQGEAVLSDEELFDMAMADRNGPAVPHAVMARLIDGENAIKVYREWRNLTQSELAAKTGVTSGYVSQVERGVRQLSRKAQAAFATALGVNPDDLEPT